MKICNDCRRYAPDNTLFCPACGASYGMKICPRSHPNPMSAIYCGRCGSPHLSRPHKMSSNRPFRYFLVTAFTATVVLLVIILSPILSLPVPLVAGILAVVCALAFRLIL